MKKPKIKIRELKPKVKIIKELPPEKKQENLEVRVDLDLDEPMVAAAPSANAVPNPTLTQRFEQQERHFEQTKREERKENEVIAYHMLHQQTSSRSYDPTIKSVSNPGDGMERISPGERINPTIQNTPLQQMTRSTDIRDIPAQTNVEPGLRRFKDDGERDYQVERAENYIAKRRTDL